jgi:dihydroxyacid dehydratase/phosphogluconate dehydratase
MNLEVEAGELAARRRGWAPPAPYATRGVLAKYAQLVSSASLGAITDDPNSTLRRVPSAAIELDGTDR